MGEDCGCVFAAIISIILGVIIGILAFIGIIVEFWALAWAAIGIAGFAILLMVLIGIFGSKREDNCVCEYGKCLTVGAFGTVFFALAIIAVVAIAGLTAISVLFGIGGFFFILMLISFFKLILCFVRRNCGCRE